MGGGRESALNILKSRLKMGQKESTLFLDFPFSLLHCIFFFMNFIKCVKTVYNRSYDRRPILTLCITNGILGAISDQLAQTITYIDYHRNIDKMHREHPHSQILDNRLPDQLRRHEDLWPPPPSFDPFRTVRFALYNFCVAPIVGKWYMVLDRFFPMPAAAASSRVKDIVAIKRMVG